MHHRKFCLKPGYSLIIRYLIPIVNPEHLDLSQIKKVNYLDVT